MARFPFASLELSNLPKPNVISLVDYETILAQRLADLKARLTANGVAYNVETLETDPAAILQQEDAYREALDRQAINDSAIAVMLPYASGTDLDNLGAFFGLRRFANETDSDFRARVQLAPEAYASTGTIGGYLYHALSASPLVQDAYVYSPASGTVRVVILGPKGELETLLSASTTSADAAASLKAKSAALVETVHTRLISRDVRPLTDIVQTVAAEIIRYSIRVRIAIPRGPDGAVVKSIALAALQTLAKDTFRVGRSLDRSVIMAAAYSPPVRRVNVVSPDDNLTIQPWQAAFCESITIDIEVVDD